VAGSLGMFLGIVCSNVAEFFYTMWLWNYAAAWAFKEAVSLPASAMKLYYAPHAFKPENPEELAFWLTGSLAATELMPSVWKIFHQYLKRTYELSPPKWSTGISPDDAKVYGASAPVLWDLPWGRKLSSFMEEISGITWYVSSNQLGFQGWSPVKELLTPKIPIYYSLAPCILELTVFWDEENRSGRVAGAVIPVTPWYITIPMIRPLAWHINAIRLLSVINPGPIWAKPKGIVRRGQVSFRGKWVYELIEGVVKGARFVTSGFANVLFGWCMKMVNFIVGQGIKEAVPLSPTLEKLLRKVKPLWKIVLTICRFLRPLNVPYVVDAGPMAVDWAFLHSLWNQMATSPVPRWIRTLAPVTYGQAVLIASLSNRTLIPNMKVFAGKCTEWPDSGILQACEECPCPHSYLMVMLPSQACEVVAEDDPGTVIEVTGTDANIEGAYWAFINWVPSIAPTLFSKVWAKYAQVWNEIAGSFDEIVETALNNVADYVEDNPIAPFSKATLSAAWAICCYAEALNLVAPRPEEVEAAIANGRVTDLSATLLARLIAFIVTFLSMYLGGGPPGLLLLWWTPNYAPPTFITRSPSMASINPLALSYGTLELLFSLPFVLSEKAEDAREGLERISELYLEGKRHPMASHLSPSAQEIQRKLQGNQP